MADVVLCDASAGAVVGRDNDAPGMVLTTTGGDEALPSRPTGGEHQCPCIHTFPGEVTIVVVSTPSEAGASRAPFAHPNSLFADRTAPPLLPPPIA